MSYRFLPGAPSRRAAAVAACLLALTAHAADEFAVSAAQMQALGVRLQRLERPADIAGPTYAARVVLPPRQEQIVSAPLAGVIDQLLVAENDAVQVGQPLRASGQPRTRRTAAQADGGRLAQPPSARSAAARTRSCSPRASSPSAACRRPKPLPSEDRARRRQAEATLRLAGVDEAAIRRVAAGGRIDNALLLRSRRRRPRDRHRRQAWPARAAGRRAAAHRRHAARCGSTSSSVAARPTPATCPRHAPSASWAAKRGARCSRVGATVSDSQTLTLRAAVRRGHRAAAPRRIRAGARALRGRRRRLGGADSAPCTRQGDQAYVFVRTGRGFAALPVKVLASAGASVRIEGELQAGQEIATASVIALKAAWQGKGGSD